VTGAATRLRASLLVLGLLLCSTCSADSRAPLPKLDARLRADLRTWMREHGASPEEYVVSKFSDHDVVFLGEYHRIRHDPILVQRLIPLLHRRGVRTLGLEFARAVDQRLIDSLLAMPAYDPNLANRIYWNQWPWWGYQEYVDILRAAWALNRELPEGAPPFRVLGLNAVADWSPLWKEEDRGNSEVMRRVLPEGSSDQVMAAVIEREVLSKGLKALVYSGIYHAFTRFHQPSGGGQGESVRFSSERMGNRSYAAIGDRCCTIFLHSPWPGGGGYEDAEVYPADGALDALIADLPAAEQRVGFDVVGSPFGTLAARSSYWGRVIPDFRLDMYCDGWICQMPLSRYEGVHVVEGWFNEQNRIEAIEQIANPDPRVKRRNRTAEDLMRGLASDTEISRRFARFQ